MRQQHSLVKRQVVITAALIFISLSIGHSVAAQYQNLRIQKDTSFTIRRFSKQVGDSFSLFVHLPASYNSTAHKSYPIVYLLDANFYFDMMAPIVSKYAEVGMLPPVILIGVGYKDFKEMDSLRDRDFTYPKSTDPKSFSISGGGAQFLTYLQNDVMPELEHQFQADSAMRILAGHSLGGFFTTYALMRNLATGQMPFRYYIAASPSLDYNHYWLLGQLKQLPPQIAGKKKVGLYITYGSLEDIEDSDMPGHITWSDISYKVGVLAKTYPLQYKTELFSSLRHMDTPIPSFIKGLQQALENY